MNEGSSRWGALQIEKASHFGVLFTESILNVQHFSEAVFDLGQRNGKGWDQHTRGEEWELSLTQVLSHVTGQLEQLVLGASVEKRHFGAWENNSEFLVEFRKFAGVWGAFGDIHQVIDVLNSWKWFLENEIGSENYLWRLPATAQSWYHSPADRYGYLAGWLAILKKPYCWNVDPKITWIGERNRILSFGISRDLVQMSSQTVRETTELIFTIILGAKLHCHLGDFLVQSLDHFVVAQQVEWVAVGLPQKLDPRDENLETCVKNMLPNYDLTSVSARSCVPSPVTDESIRSSGERSGCSRSDSELDLDFQPKVLLPSIFSKSDSSVMPSVLRPAAFLRSMARARPSFLACWTRCSASWMYLRMTSSNDLMLTLWQVSLDQYEG